MSAAEPTLTPAQATYASARLERVFAQCFAGAWRTRLVGGAAEPYYLPADDSADLHCLYYRSDFFASALHETAHWCIAGDRRRLLPDFGYWYAPDGRDADQQLAFETVEAKPQALEWLFSRACGYRFILSADNLGAADGRAPDPEPFARRVLAQALAWQRRGLPERAQVFCRALAAEFGTGVEAGKVELQLSELLR